MKTFRVNAKRIDGEPWHIRELHIYGIGSGYVFPYAAMVGPVLADIGVTQSVNGFSDLEVVRDFLRQGNLVELDEFFKVVIVYEE